jgi:ABC-type transporter Mla subunit MlaD
MQSTIEELRVAAERSRERLLTWREMLRESAHVVDSLGSALTAVQMAVQELQDTQVTATDVAESVRKQGKELEELLGHTDGRVDDISERVEAHVAEVDRTAREMRRLTDERIEDHSAQVSQMFERSNPHQCLPEYDAREGRYGSLGSRSTP